MTRSEFIAKYGKLEVTFNSYYKFTFSYQTKLPDGKVLVVGYGGNSDEIYRHEVSVFLPVTVESLEPYSGSVYDGTEEVESFYDY
jgi:hypothetical protein